MATKTVILRSRIDAARKRRVDKLFARHGLTTSQAINMFFAAAEAAKGLPFDVRDTAAPDDLGMTASQAIKHWNSIYDDDFSR